MRRLYIGGLSHSVTQKDLKDRFGKFGDVQDVELRTRRDEEGVPYKTFGYINIDISDADLKKCLTVLNKSKWKGGTLQIETAKESFLHRLSEEQQAAREQRLHPPAAEDKTQKLLDSLSKAGVDNFTMKAAVPGTEIPGHKEWVVSKFGRVLPVLQLRYKKGNKARTLKYDPSKYSHNIRRLDRGDIDQPTPVAQLTWEVQGGDDDISKKRRGEFPPYEPPRTKRSRTNAVNSNNAVGRIRSEQTLRSVNHTEPHHFTNGFKPLTNHRPAQRKWTPLTDSDVDSDEEIRRLVAAQDTSHSALYQEVREDNLEVVGLDYLVKPQQKGRPDGEDEDDYDSADTDELFASRKPLPPPPSLQEKPPAPTADHLPGISTDRKRKAKKKSKAGLKEEEEEDDSADEEDLTSGKLEQQRQNSQLQASNLDSKSKKMAVPPVKPPSSESESDGEDEDDEELESADSDSCSDSDYEAMFSNVTCLEISLADLQRIAEDSQQTSETTVPSIPGDTETMSGPSDQPAPKKGTLPEDILASIMEDDSSDDEKKKKKKRKAVESTPLPAFLGTKTLNEGSETNNAQKQEKGRGSMGKKLKLDSEAPQVDHRGAAGKANRTLSEEKPPETEEMTTDSEQDEEEAKVVPNKAPKNAEKTTSSSSGSDDDIEDNEKKIISAVGAKKTGPVLAPHTESSSSEEEEEEEEEKQAPSRVALGPKEEEEMQKKANTRRLAAIQQRMKEAEEHKKLIQGALANLDTPAAGAGKHIVFGSDEEEDGDYEDQRQTTSEGPTSKKTLFQDSQSEDEATSDVASASKNTKRKQKPSGPQLFGGSEDEEDGDEEGDNSRFDIRPQFEGRAGQKLMALQSRFGTDERFRMDSRFLEEDEEDKESERMNSVTEEDEDLEQERKKNLSILQSVLGSSQQTYSSKTASKAKNFRDVSALHYDPSKEEHAVFETITDEAKESKSARRKKREEAQKLPEVSKEIYYDVSGDLKAVFGQTKDDVTGGEENTNWDQEEEEEEEEEEDKEGEPTMSSLILTHPTTKNEESSGFKFSFFGDDTEMESKETDYKVESIQAPKVSWQQDPRFHDSSEEEDEEQEENEEHINTTAVTTEEENTSKTDVSFFFFHPEDTRLTEGPRLFFRSTQLEDQREQWEERRTALRQEYRKKHKDARRKLKSTLKS
ncbi:nucleolar protein 8 [Echeneis naucrates]|uniref:nucleolar protein 8 n=1 Tax=Echeneis naucrates TaxID=173247 RepID=UPI001113FEF2|nr:nucleolar protein 8 [Echeneis naucrates]XP_029358736.1 nucleolar protein 8 [Echeneis naucrates]